MVYKNGEEIITLCEHACKAGDVITVPVARNTIGGITYVIPLDGDYLFGSTGGIWIGGEKIDPVGNRWRTWQGVCVNNGNGWVMLTRPGGSSGLRKLRSPGLREE